MGIIEHYLSIEVVQIKFSTPDKNLINPKEVRIGRNENFTEINRLYIKCSTKEIPTNSIIKSAILSIPILQTENDDGQNNSHITGYLVTNDISNIDYVTWNNLPQINIGETIFSNDVHGNSIVEIDLKDFIGSFVNKSISNNGFLFINNEAQHNEAIIDSNLINRNGLALKVRYYDPNERIFEKSIDIQVNNNTYYTEAILSSFLDAISIFVKNNRDNIIKASLEVSCNNTDFIEESSVEEIGINESKILVPYYNGKYIRAKLATTGQRINAKVSVQARLI